MPKLTVGLLLKEARAAQEKGDPCTSVTDLARRIGMNTTRVRAFIERHNYFKALGIPTGLDRLERRLVKSAIGHIEREGTPVLDWIQSNINARGECMLDVINHIRRAQGRATVLER